MSGYLQQKYNSIQNLFLYYNLDITKGLVAQLVEQLTLNQLVESSNLSKSRPYKKEPLQALF